MGRFARDAPWISRIFQPSVAPATRQPDAVSDDVQLVSPYAACTVQHPHDYIVDQVGIPNPGQNLFVAGVNPNQVATGPEFWRVFRFTVQIPAGPAANFDYMCRIRNTVTNQTIQVDPTETIAAGNTDENDSAIPIVTVLSTMGPGEPELVIDLFQLSAQAFGTEGITFRAYVLRVPQGLTIPF